MSKHNSKQVRLDANIQSRVKWLASLLDGDDSVIPELLDVYSYIPEKTAYWCFWCQTHKIPIQDVEQQTMMEFLSILKRIKGAKERFPRLASINDCGCCVGFRPWAIKTLRGRIKDWITTSNIIRVPKFAFEDPNFLPPIVISLTISAGDKSFEQQENLGTVIEPINYAIEQQMWDRLNLTYRERQIIVMRSQSYTTREIGKVIEQSPMTVVHVLQSIQHRYMRIFHDQD